MNKSFKVTTTNWVWSYPKQNPCCACSTSAFFLAQSTCKLVLGALYDLSKFAIETVEDPNVDLRKLMNSLVERFDALQEDVEHLKEEKSACTSTRVCVDSSSDSESDSSPCRHWIIKLSRSRPFHKCRQRARRSRSWSRASHSPRRKRATNQSPREKYYR